MKYAFYPGCSLESTAWDFDKSTRAVCEALDIELKDIPDWDRLDARLRDVEMPAGLRWRLQAIPQSRRRPLRILSSAAAAAALWLVFVGAPWAVV